MAEAPSFTCPRCGATSYNAHDVTEGYCGACHDWTRGLPEESYGRPPRARPEVARLAAQIRGDGDELRAEVERLRREVFDYQAREKLWNESALMRSNLEHFETAKRLAAEVAALRDELHRTRGLYYGACAARTEHAQALGLTRVRIAHLEAEVMRLRDEPRGSVRDAVHGGEQTPNDQGAAPGDAGPRAP